MLVRHLVHLMPRIWSAAERPTPSTAVVDGRSRDRDGAGLEVIIGGLQLLACRAFRPRRNLGRAK